MTQNEYENAMIERFEWYAGHLFIQVNGYFNRFDIKSLLIPMYRAGFIEGYECGMFVIQKIDTPGETELVNVDGFMIQNVDMNFCESILKYL